MVGSAVVSVIFRRKYRPVTGLIFLTKTLPMFVPVNAFCHCLFVLDRYSNWNFRTRSASSKIFTLSISVCCSRSISTQAFLTSLNAPQRVVLLPSLILSASYPRLSAQVLLALTGLLTETGVSIGWQRVNLYKLLQGLRYLPRRQ